MPWLRPISRLETRQGSVNRFHPMNEPADPEVSRHAEFALLPGYTSTSVGCEAGPTESGGGGGYNQSVMYRILFAVLATFAILAAQTNSAFKISLEPQGELKAQKPVPIHVMVKDANGAAVAGADVELVLTMVEMDHGESKFPARQIKAGVYEAKPKFMMDGKWNIETRVKKGSTTASAKQQVDVGE
jgi:hypothetical protein